MNFSILLPFIFFFILIYLLTHIYLISKARKVLWIKKLPLGIKISFFILSLSPMIGSSLDLIFRGTLSHFLNFVGGLYFGWVFYLVSFCILIDLAWLFSRLTRIVPHYIKNKKDYLRQILSIFIIFVSFLLLILGFIQTNRLFVKDLDVRILKPFPMKKLKVFFISDLHFGNYQSALRIQKAANIIGQENADLVLLGGDLIDRRITSAEGEQFVALLKLFKARYGVFAISGNHDYYSNIADFRKYLQKAGVNLLEDKLVIIDGIIQLVGRKDRTAERLENGRKSLAELVEGINIELPLILLDHQPLKLKESALRKIDLQLSGHTHNGQFFPLKILVDRLFELSYGFMHTEGTQYYISSGLGFAGIPNRIGSHSEIIRINLVIGQ